MGVLGCVLGWQHYRMIYCTLGLGLFRLYLEEIHMILCV